MLHLLVSALQHSHPTQTRPGLGPVTIPTSRLLFRCQIEDFKGLSWILRGTAEIVNLGQVIFLLLENFAQLGLKTILLPYYSSISEYKKLVSFGSGLNAGISIPLIPMGKLVPSSEVSTYNAIFRNKLYHKPEDHHTKAHTTHIQTSVA